MMHVPPAAVTAAEPLADTDFEKAKRWIAVARKCGLDVFPWFSTDTKTGERKYGMMEFGQDLDGPNSYGKALKRFMKHPAFGLRDELPKGVLLDALCADFGVVIDEPDFCDKINVVLASRHASRDGAAHA